MTLKELKEKLNNYPNDEVDVLVRNGKLLEDIELIEPDVRNGNIIIYSENRR